MSNWQMRKHRWALENVREGVLVGFNGALTFKTKRGAELERRKYGHAPDLRVVKVRVNYEQIK